MSGLYSTIYFEVRTRLLARATRRGLAQCRNRDEQLNHLIERGLSLGERLPEVEPSGDGDSYESAHAYRERLQLILDVA